MFKQFSNFLKIPFNKLKIRRKSKFLYSDLSYPGGQNQAELIPDSVA